MEGRSSTLKELGTPRVLSRQEIEHCLMEGKKWRRKLKGKGKNFFKASIPPRTSEGQDKLS